MNTATHTASAEARLAQLAAERAAWAESPPQDATHAVLVLLRSLDLADFVHGARCFAAALTDGEAAAWRRSWTRTMFRFGNPANLTSRSPARIVAPAATSAWIGPYESEHPPGLGRLLKPVTGTPPPLPARLDLPPCIAQVADTSRFTLLVATRGLTLAGYLVHLHHTLAEAVLQGRLPPHAALRLIHRLDLDAVDQKIRALLADPEYARVQPSPEGAGQSLRLHTLLVLDKTDEG